MFFGEKMKLVVIPKTQSVEEQEAERARIKAMVSELALPPIREQHSEAWKALVRKEALNATANSTRGGKLSEAFGR